MHTAIHLACAIVMLAGCGRIDQLPWQPDYASAVAQAQAEHRHMVVLVAADGCEPAGRLETATLTAPLIRAALRDYVWVRSAIDPELQQPLQAADEPSLVFVNPFTGSVLHRVTGFRPVERLAREIVRASWAIGLTLPEELKPVSQRIFLVDGPKATRLLEAGGAAGLRALLEPAAADDSRPANYLVVQVSLPEGLDPDQVRLLAGTDCLVGVDGSAGVADPALVAARMPDLTATSAEYPLPATGVLVVECAVASGPLVNVRITAPGCLLIDDLIRFEEPAPGTAVQLRTYSLQRLADATAAMLTGRVLRPDNTPAADAIVRIADCLTSDAAAVPLVTRTDASGRFVFARVSPGRFLVRAEAPGGECEQFVSLSANGDTDRDFRLSAVTTIGIRWALQTHELVQDLSGAGVQTGAAFFSVANSRLALASGMRTRNAAFGDIMLAQTPLTDDGLMASMTDQARSALAALPAGTPVWHLFDAAYAADFSPLSGLHREARTFDAIQQVREHLPLPNLEWEIIGEVQPRAILATRASGSFFQLLRGEPVRQGDVFTLRCATSNCYAKLEVTDVTIVAEPVASPAAAVTPPSRSQP
ncbi:MAG: carboxypeptidase regulatory-like domain-containing protein [Planctomycetes bacterium]|nr:carboxypeptidase regulatory-like domain-containing protein [Planctomycetota bacterium]